MKDFTFRILNSLLKRLIINPMQYFFMRSSKNINLGRSIFALKTTIEYIESNMSNIASVAKLSQVHDLALENISIQKGMILEFGVYTGSTINYIAKKVQGSKIYGFDSFEGLPEFWRDSFGKGAFKLDRLPNVEENVMLIKGWFDETLPQFELQENIAYLHIDCDLYSSTKTIFKYVGNKIVTGTIIVFDEYFNYPGWQNGEFKAFQEYIAETGKKYQYLTYNSTHEQVAVRMI